MNSASAVPPSSLCPVDDDPRAATDELVLLVHGTFAGAEEDLGHRWWQSGSPACESLRSRLPRGARLPELGEVFHWSGENSERARIKAGTELLARMEEFETAGRGYHLIGHSHGGSVIWHALRLATLRRRTLQHLRSWSTVGTPFLHFQTRGAWSIANIVNIVLALVLLKPAYRVFVGFFGIALAALMGSNSTIELRSDAEVGVVMATARAPLLALVQWAGVPVAHEGEFLRVGSYDPDSGQSLREYLFGSWEGWIITLVIIVGGYFFLILSSLFLNPVLESLRIRAEKRLEANAMQTFRGRWLGLWSPNDEAINGLRATLDLSVSFVNQITPRETVLLSDYVALIAQPYRWLLAPMFNQVLRPKLDQFVRSFVIKSAQGNNRPAAEVVGVSPFPVPVHGQAPHPALPDEWNRRLVDNADQHARDIAPKLRELLTNPSFAAGVERFGRTLTGHELVHTSYFDHPFVLDLLALHVAWSIRRGKPLVIRSGESESLALWFREFKRTVQEVVEVRSKPAAAAHLVEPSRPTLTRLETPAPNVPEAESVGEEEHVRLIVPRRRVAPSGSWKRSA